MKRTADINEILKPLEDTPYQAYLSNAVQVADILDWRELESPFGLHKYSEKELQQIEKFASIYLKISDIAVILDIPADVLREDIADRTSEVSKAYRRGKAGSKVKLHSQEMMLAQVGSPLAIENAHRNLLDMKDDE